MRMKKNLSVFGFLVALALLGLRGFAQMPGGANNGNPTSGEEQGTALKRESVDFHALKGQLEAFQSMLNRSIQTAFEQPFSILQDAKGIYLPGFGVAFHMEVNLQPVRLLMPFDMRPYTPDELQKAKAAKLERIRQLKSLLSALLLEHGATLNAMAPEQNVAIVIHLFNLPSESRDLPTQVVITINRRMLLDYQARRLTAEEFQKAGSVLEF